MSCQDLLDKSKREQGQLEAAGHSLALITFPAKQRFRVVTWLCRWTGKHSTGEASARGWAEGLDQTHQILRRSRRSPPSCAGSVPFLWLFSPPVCWWNLKISPGKRRNIYLQTTNFGGIQPFVFGGITNLWGVTGICFVLQHVHEDDGERSLMNWILHSRDQPGWQTKNMGRIVGRFVSYFRCLPPQNNAIDFHIKIIEMRLYKLSFGSIHRILNSMLGASSKSWTTIEMKHL